ncbi:MAG TPA: TetR family transcriptional regulator [Nocardioidaceae bacterium]|nr:TetR family transcriptional regulator [Nocardioidaceae bacterium]
MSTPSTRGRRAGGVDTRGEILAAARTSFAEAGFAETSIRKVAATAGVDPALVHHYFGTKDDLFLAALQFPVDPRAVMAGVAGGDPDTLGVRLLERFLGVWESPQARLPLLALVRAGVAGEPGRSLVESALSRLVFGALGQVLELEDSDRRLSLVASQMIGLVVTRYVLRLEPLASMPAEEVAAWLGPTIQRYLLAPGP